MAPSIPSLYSSSSFASPSANPFRSLIAQRTACLDCGYVEAVRHYPADELSLGVPFRAGSATTLEMCLKSWSKLERVDWICFRCSLQKTLEKVRSDVKRLNSGTTNGHSTNGNGSAIASSAKMSNSKKKKLREARRKETVLASVLDGRLSEDEVEASRLLELADVQLERVFSALSTKQVMIARTPRVLLLHMNRSTYSASNFGASKNNATVLFDEHLDLSDIVTSGELNISGELPISVGGGPGAWDVRELHARRVLYRLCAIVVHYGSHSAGHYVSFRRRSTPAAPKAHASFLDDVDQDRLWGGAYQDGWLRISDDNVSACSLRDVLSQNPFLLFYERVEECNDAKGQNAASLPSGFETFGRNETQKRRAAYKPRLVERWNAVH